MTAGLDLHKVAPATRQRTSLTLWQLATPRCSLMTTVGARRSCCRVHRRGLTYTIVDGRMVFAAETVP